MEPFEYPAHLHRQELRAAAAEHRAARGCQARPVPVAVRLYARLWWASRPRAATWAPALFDVPARP